MSLKALVALVISFCQVDTANIEKEPGASCVDFMVNCAIVGNGSEIKEEMLVACKKTWQDNKEAIIKAFQKEAK